MAAISLCGVSKHFKGAAIIDNLNLEIADKEFMVLVGPSGCGKSTLLRMIAGLEDVTSGTIRLAGRALENVPARERNIAMVFQNYALYPHMTVSENMALSLRLQKAPRAEREKKVQHAAEILGISHLLARKPKELSGGQRQRVAMGRAIVRNPALFLFDEPLSNLDAELRLRMRTEIKRLHQQLQSTMIYVTHDQVEAMTLAHRIVVLRGGEIQQVGTPLEIYRRPVNKFVAGFMGSPAMNFLTASFKEGRLFLTQSSAECLYPDEEFMPTVESNVVVGVRPEHIVLGKLAENCFMQMEGNVLVVEPLGSEMLVYVDCSDTTLVVRTAIDENLQSGHSVKVGWGREELHLFSEKTGLTLRKSQLSTV
jgi:multiple sugar transport system ATP-binding protein